MTFITKGFMKVIDQFNDYANKKGYSFALTSKGVKFISNGEDIIITKKMNNLSKNLTQCLSSRGYSIGIDKVGTNVGKEYNIEILKKPDLFTKHINNEL